MTAGRSPCLIAKITGVYHLSQMSVASVTTTHSLSLLRGRGLNPLAARSADSTRADVYFRGTRKADSHHPRCRREYWTHRRNSRKGTNPQKCEIRCLPTTNVWNQMHTATIYTIPNRHSTDLYTVLRLYIS